MSFRWKTLGSRLGRSILTFFRLLMGGMLINNGWRWLHRPDPGAYLMDALNTIFEKGTTIGFYLPFLKDVVVPHVDLFAFLVSWGEFLSGISLFFGLASRLGAGVITFQFVNYGLMGGAGSLSSHLILSAIAVIPVVLNSGRWFGADRWLFARWPKAKIW